MTRRQTAVSLVVAVFGSGTIHVFHKTHAQVSSTQRLTQRYFNFALSKI